MLYEQLKQINEEHKKKCLATVKNSNNLRKICKFRLIKERNKWVLKGFYENDDIKPREPFNNLYQVYNFFYKYPFSYITNLSVLNNKSNSYVYTNFPLNKEDFLYIKHNLSYLNYEIKTVKFMRVENIDIYKGKAVLGGWKILWDKYPCIVVLYYANNIYVLSDCTLVLDGNKESLFCDLNCKKLYIDNLDVSRVTNLEQCFIRCFNMEEIELKNFDTSNVKTMKMMFYDCTHLKKVTLDALNTSKVVTFESMFENCRSLEQLDLRTFDTSNLKGMPFMFLGCENLKGIDISTWNLDNILYMQLCFHKCKSIESIKGLNNLIDIPLIESRKYTYDFGDCTYLLKKGYCQG